MPFWTPSIDLGGTLAWVVLVMVGSFLVVTVRTIYRACKRLLRLVLPQQDKGRADEG